MSLVRMALRQAALKVRLALPMSRVSLWPPSTTVVVRVGARESGSGIDGRVVGGGVARWIG